MAITFEQLLSAIAGQESGGLKNPYAVVNAWGAVGKYQVLKSNIPQWSKAALGYSITWQQYRDSPELQEKIVRHRMSGYFNKYGARGAASAWYSGDPKLHQNTNKQPGGPSIKDYVDSVIKRAGGMPAGGSGGGSPSGGGGGGGPTPTPMSRSEQAENYGFVESMLNAIPELKGLFEKATSGGWTASKFQAELRNTKWFKTHAESERQFLIKQYGDPATAGQMWHMNQMKVWSLGAQLGANLNWDKVNKMAYGIMALGWTDEKLRNELAKNFDINDDNRGEAGEVITQLQEYAYQMGVDVDKKWLQDSARYVVGSGFKLEDFKHHIRNLSKGLYSNWAKQIDGGQTVVELASPYMQSMATILELPPGSITLKDKTIKQALQGKDKVTGENKISTIWEFENNLRNDPRWKKTQNAQNSTMQVAHQVLADFGMVY